MKNILLLFCCIVFSTQLIGQGKTVVEVSGVYVYNDSFEVVETMTLKADSSFEYVWRAGLFAGETKGIYTLKRSRIILNSDKQPNKKSHYNLSIERDSILTDSVFIQAIDFEDTPIPFANCVFTLADDTVAWAFLDIDGKAAICNTQFDKITISHVMYETIEHKVTGEISTQYIFSMILPRIYHFRYFTNEKWKLKRKQLRQPGFKFPYIRVNE